MRFPRLITSLLFISTQIGLLANAQAEVSKVSPHCRTLGGTFSFDFRSELSGWTVATSGDLRGGAFARIVGGPRDLGEGRTEYDLEHFYQLEDGSTLATRDKTIFVAVKDDDRVLASTTYSVASATGALKGYKGQFKSWGSANPKTGQGVLRYSGELCQP